MKPIGNFPDNPFSLPPLRAPTHPQCLPSMGALVPTEMVSGKGLMYNNKNTQACSEFMKKKNKWHSNLRL
jgi:hypothetical protein